MYLYFSKRKKKQYSNGYQIHNLKDNIMHYEAFPANNPIIAHSKNIIFVCVGTPDFERDRWKSRSKTRKTVIFPGKSGQLF